MTQFSTLATHYDELMQVVPYDDWAEYVRLLWSFASHTPHRVLDCACGTGNVSFELAKFGYEVMGVDLSPEMIVVAQRKAQEHDSVPNDYRAPRFAVADLGDFDLGETFDSASCLYDSLNYITDSAHLKRAFECVRRHIEPGGVWVFDMNSDYALSADLFSQTNRSAHKPLSYEWKANYDDSTHICTVTMSFERVTPEGRETFSETHRERAYLLSEVTALLEETGWDLEYVFDAYTLNRTHDRSERWYFVARRRD